MKILIVCRSFPPINIMGAVRPYEVAKYFKAAGWKVTVICSYEDSHMTQGYEVDLSGISVIGAPKNKYISVFNKTYKNKTIEIVKKIIRKFIIPEYFVFMVKDYEEIIENYISEQGKPDFIFSTAKPISSHIVAARIKEKYPDIKWIADFRDLFALKQNNSLNFLEGMKKKLEKNILKKANFVTVVTSSMHDKMSEYIDNNIYVIRNGADRIGQSYINKFSSNETYTISFTGILYGGFIDVDPILIALENSDIKINVNFYGSERKVVDNLAKQYQKVKITPFERLPKDEIKLIQERSDFLLVGLGNSEAQKGVLPGKFFEYVETGRPIIAICDEDSELAGLVNRYSLGIATRDALKIKNFLEAYLDGKVLLYSTTPEELTRKYQLDKLQALMGSL